MKCKWCEEPVEEGRRFCDELCEKLYENHEAQVRQGQVGPREFQKRKTASHKNSIRSGGR